MTDTDAGRWITGALLVLGLLGLWAGAVWLVWAQHGPRLAVAFGVEVGVLIGVAYWDQRVRGR